MLIIHRTTLMPQHVNDSRCSIVWKFHTKMSPWKYEFRLPCFRQWPLTLSLGMAAVITASCAPTTWPRLWRDAPAATEKKQVISFTETLVYYKSWMTGSRRQLQLCWFWDSDRSGITLYGIHRDFVKLVVISSFP